MQKFDNNSDENEDANSGRYVRQFQTDFIKGSLAYLTIAALVMGDDRDSETIFNDIMDPIVGNRNRESTTFDTILPQAYEKIIEYCHNAIVASREIENKELENG